MFESGACLIAYKKGNDSLFINNCGQTVTAVSQVSREEELKIYPNPAQDEISVKLIPGKYSNYSVIDALGNEKMSGKIAVNDFLIISLRDLISGHYAINFNEHNGKKISRRIVKH
jgi:hypothetical protein